MIYHIYSDYSSTDEGSSYAFVVVCYDNGTPTFVKSGSRKLKLNHNTFVGEIMGSLAGIRCLPDGSNAIVYSDIAGVQKLVKSQRKRTRRQLSRQQKEILVHRKRLLGLQLMYLEKKKRPQAYHWCHKKARSRILAQISEPSKIQDFSEKQMMAFFTKPNMKKKKKKRPVVAKVA